MAEDKKGKHLGRGLDALFENSGGVAESPVSGTGSASVIGIGDLYPGRNQPRQIFAESEIEELAESIRNLGILQPLIVRPDAESAGGYEIIAGERRWRAAQLAQLDEVPAIVRHITDSESLEIALVENLQRENLSPLEEAEGYRRLIDEYQHTQDALGQILGKSRSHVANTLRLLALPDAIKDMVNGGLLSAGHGRALLGSDDPLASAEAVVRRGLNVRQTERLVAKAQEDTRERAIKPRKKREKDADTMALENDLSAFLGLRVGIDFYDPGGRLTITYQSLEQLDDILHRLTAGAHAGAHSGSKDSSTAAEPATEMLAEGEAELTAAAVAEINQLGDAGSSDLNILGGDVDAAITELEKGAAWEEDVEEVEFDLESNLTMSDDDTE
ncbi:MAG: ParB/RepB/Spo0J family partition protein [Pseudomonadota bacterium]|nr:ParB/RepB/Spo0J family partition protein [Pseudomonadota bacterium]